MNGTYIYAFTYRLIFWLSCHFWKIQLPDSLYYNLTRFLILNVNVKFFFYYFFGGWWFKQQQSGSLTIGWLALFLTPVFENNLHFYCYMWNISAMFILWWMNVACCEQMMNSCACVIFFFILICGALSIGFFKVMKMSELKHLIYRLLPTDITDEWLLTIFLIFTRCSSQWPRLLCYFTLANYLNTFYLNKKKLLKDFFIIKDTWKNSMDIKTLKHLENYRIFRFNVAIFTLQNDIWY